MTSNFNNGYALLIGVNDNFLPDLALPDVEKDVEAICQVLTSPERCAYPAEQVEVLIGENATRQNILDELENLQESIQADEGENTTAFVYYSGHGWRDGDSEESDFYFIPFDMRVGKYRARALRAQDFAEAIENLNPKRLFVVLDCCHAAGMGVKGDSINQFARVPAPVNIFGRDDAFVAPSGAKSLESLSKDSGRAVLTSSQADELSYIRKDGKMSIFTYHLIEALTGHAQPQEGASEVLVSDVMSFVHREVPKSALNDWSRIQRPDYRVSGNFPVAMLLGGKGLSTRIPAPDPLAAPPPPTSVIKKYKARRDIYAPEGDINIDTIDNKKIDISGGDFRGAILNVQSTLNNVTNAIHYMPDVDNDTKIELEDLVKQLESALERTVKENPEKAEDAEAVANLSESLITQASAEKPNKPTLQITGEGLKKAARNLAEITPDVLDIATKIVSLVAAFSVAAT